ncbi:hypothetical protein Sango_2912100 [Sesamum angolense]|uniref:Uncharacterized protein n=1 Tax=Sesamum angolense TaxID=2727404 RepID=A0AAE1T5W2_9LAMI|nr:hypothetical protein Sango_2912100 [Sesamum angolense]
MSGASADRAPTEHALARPATHTWSSALLASDRPAGAATAMLSSAKFLKEVFSNKIKWEGGDMVKLNEECSAILQCKLPPKLKDPRSFSIPCTIGNINFDKALCDLDMEEDKHMPLILGKPFLAISRALIDVQNGQFTFRVNDEHVVFNMFKPMKYLCKNEHDIFTIDSINASRIDNVHLVKCEDPKEDCIENSNGDNLLDMKEEHGDVPSFVDTG